MEVIFFYQCRSVNSRARKGYLNHGGINMEGPRGVNCINPFPHGMFWTKVIYDLASSEPYSLSSLNSKNLKKIRKCLKRSW